MEYYPLFSPFLFRIGLRRPVDFQLNGLERGSDPVHFCQDVGDITIEGV